jgi:hypothetical protein
MFDFGKKRPPAVPAPTPTKATIAIELDLATAQMQIFAQIETPEQRLTTAQVLADAIKIVLRHRPKQIVPAPPGFDATGKNNKPPLAAA